MSLPNTEKLHDDQNDQYTINLTLPKSKVANISCKKVKDEVSTLYDKLNSLKSSLPKKNVFKSRIVNEVSCQLFPNYPYPDSEDGSPSDEDIDDILNFELPKIDSVPQKVQFNATGIFPDTDLITPIDDQKCFMKLYKPFMCGDGKVVIHLFHTTGYIGTIEEYPTVVKLEGKKCQHDSLITLIIYLKRENQTRLNYTLVPIHSLLNSHDSDGPLWSQPIGMTEKSGYYFPSYQFLFLAGNEVASGRIEDLPQLSKLSVPEAHGVFKEQLRRAHQVIKRKESKRPIMVLAFQSEENASNDNTHHLLRVLEQVHDS